MEGRSAIIWRAADDVQIIHFSEIPHRLRLSRGVGANTTTALGSLEAGKGCR